MGCFTPCLIGDRGICTILEGHFFQDLNFGIKNRVFQHNRLQSSHSTRLREGPQRVVFCLTLESVPARSNRGQYKYKLGYFAVLLLEFP